MVMFKEPIVFCTCMYLALQFGIFYIFFQVYPIVFQGNPEYSLAVFWMLTPFRHLQVQRWTCWCSISSRYVKYPKISSELCTEILVGVGGVIACGIAIWYDSFLERAKQRNALWPKSEEYR